MKRTILRLLLTTFAVASAFAQSAGQLSVGVSAAACIALWGAPQEINRTTTAGHVNEQWVYVRGYLYLDNGILTAIQDTPTGRTPTPTPPKAGDIAGRWNR